MLVTSDAALYVRALKLSNHGRNLQGHAAFRCDEFGYKFKMSNLQAALGLAQVERIEPLIARKQHILAWYRQALAGLPLTMNIDAPDAVSGAWMPTIILEDSTARDAVLSGFAAAGINGRPFFPSLSTMQLVKARHPTPIARLLGERGLNLPSYHDMTLSDQQRVIDVVRTTLRSL